MNENRVIFYKANDKIMTASVVYKNGIFWLTQKSMAELFKVSVDNIGLHLKNIYKEEELSKRTTIDRHKVIQKEGLRKVQREVLFYNLEAAMLVAFRIKTKEAKDFRKWVMKVMSNYMVKGFAIDDLLLKNTKPFGDSFYDELEEIVKETV